MINSFSHVARRTSFSVSHLQTLHKIQVRFKSDISGKVIIITGASSGIGKEAAYELATQNAHVILACRSKSKTDPIVQDIRRVSRNEKVEFMELDTASIKSVKKFVDEFKKKKLPIHALVNNAGIAGYSGLTDEGYELQMATNYLGAPSRIINVSSDVYRSVKQLDYEKFTKVDNSRPASLHCYTYSKFAQVAFSNKLARKLISKNAKVYSMSVHPGFIASDIWRSRGRVWKWFVSKLASSSGKGAGHIVRLINSPFELLKNGGFYDREKLVDSTPFSNNEEIQKDIWDFSEQACSNALSGKSPEPFKKGKKENNGDNENNNNNTTESDVKETPEKKEDTK